MSYTPFPISDFGGLDLVTDPADLNPGDAIDLLNVTFDRRGTVKTRAGYDERYATSELYTEVHVHGSHVLTAEAGAGATIRAINRSTWASASTTAQGSPELSASFSRAGASGHTYIGVGSSSGGVQIKKWNGSAFSSPAGLAGQYATHLATQPKDDRLVAADVQANPSRVRFSNAGDPETFGANDYIDAAPGDGDAITGMAVYADRLIVFKPQRYFTFYGNVVSNTGDPIFSNREISVGVGCVANASGVLGNQLVTTGRDGVYFVAEDGVYRTVGEYPTLVSGPIACMWEKNGLDVPSYFTPGRPANWTSIERVRDRIYLTGDAGEVFVFDGARWSYFELPDTTYALTPNPDEDGFYFVGNGVFEFGDDFTTDDGTAIPARYQSAFYELAPGQEAFTRWTRVIGSGSPTVDVYTDHATSDPLSRGGAVTLGTAPAVAEGYHQKSYAGRKFSHRFSSTTGAWSVSSLTHDIAHARP